MSRHDEARALAEAIHEVLTVPRPARGEDWARSDRLLAARSIYVRGALRALVEGEPDATPEAVAAAVRGAPRALPVTYAVADEPDEPDERGQ